MRSTELSVLPVILRKPTCSPCSASASRFNGSTVQRTSAFSNPGKFLLVEREEMLGLKG